MKTYSLKELSPSPYFSDILVKESSKTVKLIFKAHKATEEILFEKKQNWQDEVAKAASNYLSKANLLFKKGFVLIDTHDKIKFLSTDIICNTFIVYRVVDFMAAVTSDTQSVDIYMTNSDKHMNIDLNTDTKQVFVRWAGL